MFSKRGKDESGQAAAEMGLLAPIIIFIFFIAIELSVMGVAQREAKVTAQIAAVEAAQYLDEKNKTTLDSHKETEIVENLKSKYPIIKNADFDIEVSDDIETEYLHSRYPVAGGFKLETRSVSHREVQVTVTEERRYITPMGAIISLVTGEPRDPNEPVTYTVRGAFEAPFDTTAENWN